MSSKPQLFIVEMLRTRPASISLSMSQFTSGSCISVLSTTSRMVAIGGCMRWRFFSLMISVIAISISSAAVFMPFVLIIHSVQPQALPVLADLLLDVLVWINKYYSIVVHAVWVQYFWFFLCFLSCDFVSCHLAWVLWESLSVAPGLFYKILYFFACAIVML